MNSDLKCFSMGRGSRQRPFPRASRRFGNHHRRVSALPKTLLAHAGGCYSSVESHFLPCLVLSQMAKAAAKMVNHTSVIAKAIIFYFKIVALGVFQSSPSSRNPQHSRSNPIIPTSPGAQNDERCGVWKGKRQPASHSPLPTSYFHQSSPSSISKPQ